MIDVFYVRGGDKDAPNVCHESGMLYGARNDYKAYDRPLMIDIRWKSYNWKTYLKKIRAHNPALVMVADFESIDQLGQLMQQIDDLRSFGVKVLVCPKFVGATSYIPLDCRIAISVKTTYAGFEPDPSEVAGRDLHLLGGHPDQQAYMIHFKYKNARVVSADGNILGYKAAVGQMWAQGTWKRVNGSTHQIAVQSAKNVISYLNSEIAPTIYLTKRVKRTAQPTLLEWAGRK